MKGYVVNIEKATEENENFRKVLYTAKNSQLVVMTLKPGEDIEIQVTGLRPGEKLYEELHADGETHLPTRHLKIMIADRQRRDPAAAAKIF